MSCNSYTIKVAEGNEFSILIPLKKRTFESCDPIDEDIDCTLLEDCVVTLGGVEYTPSLGTDGVQIVVPSTLARGTYDLVLTATYGGGEIRAAYESAITIVKWNKQSDAEQFLPGSPVVCDPAYVIGGSLTDAEVEALKAELQEKIDAYDDAIAEAQAAKEVWEQSVIALDGMATEANATLNKEAVIAAITAAVESLQGSDSTITLESIISAINNIDFSALAKEDAATLNKEAILEAITSAITYLQGGDATATLAALKTAIANINIDTTELAKQGSDSTVSLTSVDSKLGTYVQATEAEEEAALEDLDEQLENL